MAPPHVSGWEHHLGRLAWAASGADPGPDAGPAGAPGQG